MNRESTSSLPSSTTGRHQVIVQNSLTSTSWRPTRTFGGIRIEDDVLITKDGCRFLGKDRIPYHPKDVEELHGSQQGIKFPEKQSDKESFQKEILKRQFSEKIFERRYKNINIKRKIHEEINDRCSH